MSGPVSLWHETAELYTQRIGEIGDDQWSASTPCAEWTVRELVDHATGVQARVAAAVGADIADGADWATVRTAMATALEQPDALEGTLPPDSPMGPMPKHQVLGIAISDLLLHTWDVARSIGADETLPPAAVEATMMGLSRMPEEMMRGPGRFDPVVEVGDDASAQDKMIAFSGRQP